jgi:integrase/recombinase XerD
MKQALDAIASLLTSGECDYLSLDWAKIRYHHTSSVRSILRQRYAPATANKMLSALKRVLQEAYRLDLLDADAYTKAVDLTRISESRKLKGRALKPIEISALMQTCLNFDAPIDVRDAALIAILRGTGIRRAELCHLNLEDFEPDSGALQVCLGKGQKDRTVYLPHEAIAFVERWIAVRGSQSGPLLLPIRCRGKLQWRQLTPDGILKIVQRRGRMAGIESFSPHDFRRTFCSDLLDAGVDIATVQKLAGHASPVTTVKYDRRGEETKRAAVQKLSF